MRCLRAGGLRTPCSRATPDPARAELTARAKEEQAAKENKQARNQRKRMKRIMEKLAEAKRSER